MKTRATLIGIAGAAALATAAWAPAAAAPASSDGVHLDARFAQAKTVDVAPVGPSLGDEQVVNGLLRDRSGKKVGRFGFICSLVGVHGKNTLEHCAGWGALKQGQITVAGMSAGQDTRHVWAITGGTGAYRQARGQIKIHDLTPTNSHITLQLAK